LLEELALLRLRSLMYLALLLLQMAALVLLVRQQPEQLLALLLEQMCKPGMLT
jgi:hypothetical protein